MRFIDANVFVRYLTQDDMAKAEAARTLFDRLRGEVEEATTCEAAIAEIVFILGSRKLFNLSPAEVREKLTPLLLLPGLRLARCDVYLMALDLIVETPSLDFADALCAAHMERLAITDIYSYDEDFDRIGGVRRIIPGTGE